MKPAKSISAKLVITCFISLGICSYCNAQKLPNVQQNSVWAPANIKIDGRATEWNNKFQAYNKHTDVFYTIANDDNNLYLTVQARSQAIIKKIAIGGIAFTIEDSGNDRNKNAIVVTFPAYDDSRKSLYLILDNRPEPTKDTVKNIMQADSFMNALNKQLTDHFKIIQVEGIKAIPDNVISIYNQDGIKAAACIDHEIFYTYELALPLKYLNVITDGPSKFSYNVKLNGTIPKGGVPLDDGRPDIIHYMGTDGRAYVIGRATPENLTLAYPTDFWGEYTLARK